MTYIELACVLAVAVFATAAAPGRLAGGSEIVIGDAPYVASITYHYPRPNITVQRCAGALISSWHVLTSAYCFRGANLQNMRVQAGSTNSLSGGIVAPVSHFVAHPAYAQQPRANDIAVLFVSQPFPITPEVNVVFLPPPGFPLPTGSVVTVAGWGFPAEQGDGGVQLENLHAITLSTVSQEECQAAFADSDAVLIDENTTCAYAEDQGICNGDSGAPLVQTNVVLGVTSYYENCDSTHPDVFTHVPNFTEWILSVAVAPPSYSEGLLKSPTVAKV